MISQRITWCVAGFGSGNDKNFVEYNIPLFFKLLLISKKNNKGHTSFQNRLGPVKQLRSFLLTRMFEGVVDDEIVQFHFAGIRLHLQSDRMGTGGEGI